MHSWLKIGAIAAVWFVAAGQHVAAGQPSVEAFGNLPFMDAPQISPDGKHFAVTQSLGGRPAIAIYTVNAEPDDKPVVISPADWIIDGAEWLKMNRKVGDEQNLMHTWTRAVSVDL